MGQHSKPYSIAEMIQPRVMRPGSGKRAMRQAIAIELPQNQAPARLDGGAAPLRAASHVSGYRGKGERS